MGRTTLTATAGGFIALLLVSSTAYSQVSFAQYLECDLTREARADTIVTEIVAPVLDRLVSEGKLQGYSWGVHVVGGKWRRLSVVTGTDVSTVLSARAEFLAELLEKHPLEVRELISICYTHEDYIWRAAITRP
jgi:hypothetical protein